MAYAVSKTSGLIGLVDIAFGYLLAQWYFSLSGMPWDEQLLVSTVFGGIFGVVTFYISPIERLMSQIYILNFKLRTLRTKVEVKTSYDSSYLLNPKSKIASAYYLFVLLFLFSIATPPAFKDVSVVGIKAYHFSLMIGVIIVIVASWDAIRLPTKINTIIGFNYLMVTSPHQELVQETIGHALELGNWDAAKNVWQHFDKIISLKALSPSLKVILEYLQKIRDDYASNNETAFFFNLLQFGEEFSKLIIQKGLSRDLKIASEGLSRLLIKLDEVVSSFSLRHIANEEAHGKDHQERQIALIQIISEAVTNEKLLKDIDEVIYQIENLLYYIKGTFSLTVSPVNRERGIRQNIKNFLSLFHS